MRVNKRHILYLGKYIEMSSSGFRAKHVVVLHRMNQAEQPDYQDSLKNELKQIGYLAEYPEESDSPETICQNILDTEAGIYDVTGYDANILIYLGVSIALNRPTIIIAKDDLEPLINVLQELNPLRYGDPADFSTRIGEAVRTKVESYHGSGMSPRFCAVCGLDCSARKPRQSPENEYLPIGADPDKDRAIFFHLTRAVKLFNLSRQELEGDFNLTVCKWVEEIKRSKIVFFHSREGNTRHSGSDNASTMVRTGIAIGLGIAWRMILKQGERMPTDLDGYKYVTWQSSATAFDATLGGAVRTLLSEASPYMGMYDPLIPVEAAEEDEESELILETDNSAEVELGENVVITEVNFSSYFPPQVEPDKRYGFYVYVHLENALEDVNLDVGKFKDELGNVIPTPKRSKQKARLQTGTPITIIPECNEIEFDPPQLTKRWNLPWSRFGFDLKAKPENADETLFVRVSIRVLGIEIAHIKCAIEVIKKVEKNKQDATQSGLLANPLATAKARSQTVTPYQRIFISYSRRDSRVAKAYKIAQTALGNDAFLDVDNLRAGEDWRAALARAIDEADIFQLFWSEHSASSEYCRYEWDYALKVRCPDDTCEGFIRPVYWREPMPSPPSELSRINFRFVPFEDQDD